MLPGRRPLSAALVALALAGCGKSESDYQPRIESLKSAPKTEYTLGIHPLHNPQLLFASFGPLIEYINARSPDMRLRLVASKDYASFESKLNAGEFDFALPNPYEALQAQRHGYRIFGKEAGDDRFRGILLVRKDSRIKRLTDLRGKTISYPAPTALAATMMPQYFLETHGVPVKDTRTRYVGSQESSIESVYLRFSDAAATWPPPWESYARTHPKVAAALEARWRTEPLINNGLVARTTVSPVVVENIGRLLFSMSGSPEGRRILQRAGVVGFERASEATYQPVATFLRKFDATVRPSVSRSAR